MVLLSGPIASGKTTLAAMLARDRGYQHVRVRRIIESLSGGSSLSRANLQAVGLALEEATEGKWLGEALVTSSVLAGPVVIDAVRTLEQLTDLRARTLSSSIAVHVTARLEVRRARFKASEEGARTELLQAQQSGTDPGAETLSGEANVVLDTSDSSPEESFHELDRALRHS